MRTAIKSAWSLEILLLLARSPDASWTVEALIKELRGSQALVGESLTILQAAGLVEANGENVRYKPQTREHTIFVGALIELYALKPTTVLRTIFTSPSDKIRSFSDAFLFQTK